MTMGPAFRKFALTAHVAVSVGWLGAVVGFLALALAALVSEDLQRIRSAHVAMELTARFAIVPLSVASLASGLIQSLSTTWGIFRHYWVLFKLLINLFASVVLLMYMKTLDYFAGIAADTAASSADLLVLRSPSPAIHAGGAVFLLLVATTLAIYKPRGLTPYGVRKWRQ
jgi:hypothetical protein